VEHEIELLIHKNRSGPICTVKAFVDVASNATKAEPAVYAAHVRHYRDTGEWKPSWGDKPEADGMNTNHQRIAAE
jgi:hypothetical protein